MTELWSRAVDWVQMFWNRPYLGKGEGRYVHARVKPFLKREMSYRVAEVIVMAVGILAVCAVAVVILVVVTIDHAGGQTDQQLAELRFCESGGHQGYGTATGNGYYGAYQFLPSTWDSIASQSGRPDLVGVPPHLASPADQDAMARALYARSGAGQWPVCGRALAGAQPVQPAPTGELASPLEVPAPAPAPVAPSAPPRFTG